MLTFTPKDTSHIYLPCLLQDGLLTLKCSATLSNFFLKSETFVMKRKSYQINKSNNRDEDLGGKLLGLFEFEDKQFIDDRSSNIQTNQSESLFEKFSMLIICVTITFINLH